MSKYKGIIFDLDGTLLNTIDDITDAINYSLEKNGFEKVSSNQVKYYVGSGVKVLISRALKDNPSKITRTDELYECVYNDYMYSYDLWKINKTRPYEGVVRTLNILKHRGIKLAVFSNKPQRDTLGVIKKYFNGIFDVVQGQIDGVPIKPNPEGVFLILNKMGLKKEEVLYVGDSDIDVETYLNAGIDGMGMCYGFRTKKELVDAGATITANSPREILKYFDSEYNGVLLVDKPYGMTSQDVVTTVKKKLLVDKVGHAGTLDPLATGLLVVLLGDATKISNYLLEEEKEYIAEITIGEETNTWDKEGEINLETKKEVTNRLPIDKILLSLEGNISLQPPMHSAIKMNGKKLYDIARSGKTIDLPERESIIYSITRVSNVKYDNKLAVFEFACKVSKGTYIRSICHLIGKKLGYPAYMTNLRRISSGQMSIKNAYSLNDILNDKFSVIDIIESLNKQVIFPIRSTLLPYIMNGREVRLPTEKPLIFITYENKLLAIYERLDDGSYKARRVWK